MIAIQQCHLPIIRHLIDAGSRVNKSSLGAAPGMTALMIACHGGKGAIVSMLIQRGAEMNTQSRLNGWTSLMYAANTPSSLSIVKMLVENGADCDVKAWSGQTVIDIAKSRNHADVVTFLEGLKAATGVGSTLLRLPGGTLMDA
jgi:ankyrin repeat protein